MKTYKMELLTIDELLETRLTKGDTWKDAPFNFDYALPQGWLDAITKFAIDNGFLSCSYDVILSTTVWSYENGYGAPETCCFEVADLIKNYNNSLTI